MRSWSNGQDVASPRHTGDSCANVTFALTTPAVFIDDEAQLHMIAIKRIANCHMSLVAWVNHLLDGNLVC